MSTSENQAAVLEKVKYVTSQEFQAAFDNDDYDDYALTNRMKYEPDYMAFVAVKYTARRMLPYGRWTCDDGRVVIFNREYQPIFQRVDGVNRFILHSEFIKDIAQVEYFYGDHNSPVDYMTRKFKPWNLAADHAKLCKRSLKICLNLVRQFEPKPEDHRNGGSWAALRV